MVSLRVPLHGLLMDMEPEAAPIPCTPNPPTFSQSWSPTQGPAALLCDRLWKGSIQLWSSLTHMQKVLIISSISAPIVALIQEMKDNFWDKEVMTVTAF